jgi:hypothetical protein
MYNRSINLNGTNMHDLWVIKWQRSTACESEFDYPWWNICDSDDIKNLPSVASLRSRLEQKNETTNNTTPNLTTIISTYIKLARLKS